MGRLVVELRRLGGARKSFDVYSRLYVKWYVTVIAGM